MEKDLLGTWGSDLTDGAYARAVAALGALESQAIREYPASDDPDPLVHALKQAFASGDRTVVWRGSRPCLLTEPTFHTNARAMARAWQLFLNFNHPRYLPRLAVGYPPSHCPPASVDLEGLFGWLAHPDVHGQALVLRSARTPGETSRTVWHWPVHIGFPAGPAGEAWLAEVRGRGPSWLRELARPFLVGEGRDHCDLLIVPPGMAERRVEVAGTRLRASFVAFLDDPVGWRDVPELPHAALLRALGASGIGLVGRLDRDHFRLWYEMLVRELSHDLPIHAALWGIGVHRSGILPAIFGVPEALDRLRILAIAERLDRTLAAVSSRLLPPTLEGAKGFIFGPRLAGYVRDQPFSAETEDGIPIAGHIADRQAEIDKTAPPRWLQARMWARAPKEGVPLEPHDTTTLLAVHIGPPGKPRTDAAFPDLRLDFTTGAVQVSVQVEVVGALTSALSMQRDPLFVELAPDRVVETFLHGRIPPLALAETTERDGPVVSVASADISLPAVGNSEVAYFLVRPERRTDKVYGRVSVVHGNRVIQTAVFEVPVDEVVEVAKLDFRTETTVHGRTDDLEERRAFDVALIAADDFGSQLRLTVNHDGTATEVFLSSVQEPIAKIRRIVEQGANRLPDTLPLDDDRMRRVLRSLVSYGKLLYDDLKAALGKSVDDFKRIQLTTRGSAFFPVEYIYDGPTLDLSATVCAEAANALVQGSCETCSHKGARDTICPLHFWGFTRVIERYASGDVEGAATPVGAAAAERLLPSPTRTSFGAARPVLFAASDRAFDFTSGAAWRTRLIEALRRLDDGAPPGEAPSWDAWRDMIATTTRPRPKVLVLLPHATLARDLFDVDALEIGTGAQLSKDQIGSDIIGDIETPQLLLLLGCSTAGATEIFAPYPQLFRRAGADVIIASIAPILGADAAPIAERIADLLTDQLSQGKEVAFGELLLDVRRQLLAGGHPGVLGLVGFGDGDWLFGGAYAEV